MPRLPGVRWSDRERCWISDCGDLTEDRSGRVRRKRVHFREDEHGPIPYGPKPRSDGYLRARRALERRIEDQARRERPAEAPPPTVMQVVAAWKASLARRIAKGELEERSRRSLDEGSKKFMNWPESDPIGFRLAASVTPRDLELWIEEMQGEGRAPHYIRRLVGSVQQMWTWAAENDLIPKDTLRRVKRPRAPKGTGRRPDRGAWRVWRRRRWAECRAKARKAERTTDRVCLLLTRAIADTGARPEELCRARWSELDWQLLAVVPEEFKTDGYEGKVRAIFFPRRWARALKWLKAHGHPEYLFWHRYVAPRKAKSTRKGDPEHGEPWNANALAKKLRKWGMPCWPYDLRRLVASEMADSGLEYRRIADLLGNSEDLVRSVYVRRKLTSLREEFDRARGERRGGGRSDSPSSRRG